MTWLKKLFGTVGSAVYGGGVAGALYGSDPRREGWLW
jgi:hypothetical protein